MYNLHKNENKLKTKLRETSVVDQFLEMKQTVSYGKHQLCSSNSELWKASALLLKRQKCRLMTACLELD